MPCGGADMMCVFVQLFSRMIQSSNKHGLSSARISHHLQEQRNHLPLVSVPASARESRYACIREAGHARRPHRP